MDVNPYEAPKVFHCIKRQSESPSSRSFWISAGIILPVVWAIMIRAVIVLLTG